MPRGTGLPIRYPASRPQRASRRKFAWSSASTPSAMTFRPKGAGERDHGRDERHGVRFPEHRDDEGPVDLERLHRSFARYASDE